MKVKSLILNKKSTIKDIIRLLDENGTGLLTVVNYENCLIGIVTDGDLRRALLNDNLDLKHIINKNPFKMKTNTSFIQRQQYLKKIRRRHLPIVDKNNKLIDVFYLDDIDFNLKSNYVVIMAGGRGSRLGKLTHRIPKPMLQVGDQPIIEKLILSFVAH